MRQEWRAFKGSHWIDDINVRDFIQYNYTQYEGDEGFLEEPTEATHRLWATVQALQKQERERGGVLDMETKVVSGITAYPAAYIDGAHKDLEKVVGLRPTSP